MGTVLGVNYFIWTHNLYMNISVTNRALIKYILAIEYSNDFVCVWYHSNPGDD
jgi:hypothetical protein